MKILITESQYEKLVSEVQHHPENHDIEQRELRMGRLESGVKVVMEWVPREYKTVKVGNQIMKIPMKTKEGFQSKIIGNYIMTSDVSQLINNRLDEIYTYTFPKDKNYAVLVYDFVLMSKDVLNQKILYRGEPDDLTIRNEVKEVIKNKELTGPTLSLTGYEEIDKSKPGSKLSDEHRAHYLVMVINRNVATTVMLTPKNKFDEKNLYGVYRLPIDEYIRFDQVPNHATRVSSYRFTPKTPNVGKPNIEKDSENKESKVLVSKDLKESWIMEWVNSVKK
jgi:hypothetical protein